jgi:hypothetical protein
MPYVEAFENILAANKKFGKSQHSPVWPGSLDGSMAGTHATLGVEVRLP